jgi:branched-chain amino acid transport system ATP-binding protein
MKDSLEACGITVRFEGLTALEGVNLELRRGEVLGLIGPNGAGKTTLVNVLTSFQPAVAGAVLLRGQSINGQPPHLVSRRGVARTFQAGRLFKNMSVFENVEVAAVNMGIRREEARVRTREILRWMGLLDKTQMTAGALTYADERRVGIARSLAMRPSFLLLDEPVAGMSDGECDEFMDVVRQIPKWCGAGVLLIEHNMRVVMGVCERVQVLDSGKTIAVGTPDEIRENQGVISAYLSDTGRS